MTRKWRQSERWSFHPDEHSGIDWNRLDEIFARPRARRDDEPNLLSGSLQNLRDHPRLVELNPTSSADSSIIQMADLFAGLTVFSWRERPLFLEWEAAMGGQTSLLESAVRESWTPGERNRCRVLSWFLDECKKRKLGVGLSSGGLRTRPWHRPLNFWPFEAQSLLDKAPLKEKTGTPPK